MVYNATGDLTGITHVTTGTVATLNPVGNGVSQVTSITQGASPAVNSSVATGRALGLVKPMFLPAALWLPAFNEAAVGKFVAWCAGMSGAGLGIIVADAAKDASCDGGSSDVCKKPDEKYCDELRKSILNTCAGLTGQKKTRCLWVAEKTYRQCMGYE